MTDAETIADLRAELARVKAERDALQAEIDAMDRCIAELAVATACEECGEAFSLARIIAGETLCEGCQSEADEEVPPC
jgi:formylmethanofuran dehydrogenase subunit E